MLRYITEALISYTLYFIGGFTVIGTSFYFVAMQPDCLQYTVLSFLATPFSFVLHARALFIGECNPQTASFSKYQQKSKWRKKYSTFKEDHISIVSEN